MDIESLKCATCPDCNGSGVYQEYDEYDRYYVHTCSKCDGAGEITLQSINIAKSCVHSIDRRV